MAFPTRRSWRPKVPGLARKEALTRRFHLCANLHLGEPAMDRVKQCHTIDRSRRRLLGFGALSAIGLLGITYPIAQDNEFRTWNAWSNQAWPTFYLLDREGQVRLVREGEGHSREIEDAVRTLLGLGPVAWRHRTDDADRSRIGTPEIHFGSVYPTPQDLAQSPRQGESIYVFSRPGGPRLNEYELNGSWMRSQEALVLRSPNGGLRIRFSAAKFYLVAGSPQPMPVRVRVDGRTERSVVIGSPTLYTLLEGDRYGEHLLELDATTPGLSLYSATFG